MSDAKEQEVQRVIAVARLLLDRAWQEVGVSCPLAENDAALPAPSESELAEARSLVADINPAELDGDALGTIYEKCLDERRRRAFGQFYTPQPVVSFLWDRLDRRAGVPPAKIGDFSTGSGAFLVEAARRIRQAALARQDATLEDLRQAAAAICQGLCGVEVDPVACYLTKVNLLLQLTPIFAAMQCKGWDGSLAAEDCKLCIVQEDALKLHEGSAVRSSGFDYVISNPPYLGEKGHKDVFRKLLRDTPYWKQYYQGKMDYFYWFIILGLSKLRPGGRLGYITTGYWHTADGASKLRRYILDHAKIVEMIHFGHTPLFPDAPGQHNMVFVLERCDDEAKRRGNVPKMVEVGGDGRRNRRGPLSLWERVRVRAGGAKVAAAPQSSPACARETSLLKPFCTTCPHPSPLRGTREAGRGEGTGALLAHIQSHMDIAPGESYEDEQIRVFWSPVPQGELSEQAWHIFHEDDAEAVLRQIAAAGQPLGEVCRYVQGVVSGADRVTGEHLRHLSAEIVEQHGIHEGDGIFVLTAEELARLDLSERERSLVKRTYKNSQVARYAVDADGDPAEFLLYIAPGCGFSPTATPALYMHLEKFKAVLQRKRECQILDRRSGEPRRQWFELHWPRDQAVLDGEKLVTPRRAAENRFAYVAGAETSVAFRSAKVASDACYFRGAKGNTSGCYENSDLAILVRREGVREGLKYLLALLNSAVLDFWYAHRGKHKGRMREYYRTPLEAVPIRRIRFEPATDKGEKRALLERLQADLLAERYEAAYAILRDSLACAQEDVVHDGLELLADRMIDLTTALSAYNKHFGTRLARLRPDEPLPAPRSRDMLKADQIVATVGQLRRNLTRTQAVIEEIVMDLYEVRLPVDRRQV